MTTTVLAPPVTADATRRRFLAMLAAAGLLGACADDNGEESAPPPQTRSVEHFFGTTPVPVAPQRIVAASSSVLGNLLEMGVSVMATTVPNVAGSLDYLGERLLGIDTLGSEAEPNIEAIAAQQPDLILTIGAEFARDTYDSLRELAPTVGPTYGYATVEEVRTFLLECGICVGRDDAARDLAEKLDQRIAELRARIEESFADRKATLLRVSSDSYSIRVGDTPAGLLDALGVARPEGQEFDAEEFSIELSLENIGELEHADVIFVYSDADADDQRAILEDNPLWETLPAVQDGQVFFVPGAVWAVGVDIVALRLMLDEMELRLASAEG